PDNLAGQRIEIRLDTPTGPLIGTLTIQSTGGYGNFVRQTAPITPTTDAHDVYLVLRGRADGSVNYGAGSLDWFSFARDAAPAAPTNLIANSAGAHIDLTWTSNSSDQSGFVIERSADGGTTFNPVATVPANVTQYSDSAVP